MAVDTQELSDSLKTSYKQNEHNRLQRLILSIYYLPELTESTNNTISVPIGDFHRAVNDLVGFTAIDGSNINVMLRTCIPRLDGIVMIDNTGGKYNLSVNVQKMREMSLEAFIGMAVRKPPRKTKSYKRTKSSKVRKQPKFTTESTESTEPEELTDVDLLYQKFNDSIAYIVGSLCKLKIETEISIQFEISADVDRRIIHINF